MRFGSGRCDQAERANLLLLALASLLVRGGERVGFLGTADAPAASRLALRASATPCSIPPAGKAGARERCRPAAAPIARGSQLVWFSDFLDARCGRDDEGLSRAWASVGHLVRIVDPAEEDFPYTGRTRFESPRGQDSAMFGRAESVSAGLSRPLHRPWRKDRRSRHKPGLEHAPCIAPIMRRRRR